MKKLLLVLILLLGAGFLIVASLAQQYSRLDRETVAKLKRPMTPEQGKKLLALTTPFLGPPSKAPKPRAVILGMDGLDFQYLDPLIQQGKLPNFKKIKEEGVSGTLLSIIPPSSAGAWPSMMTGCGPGKTNLLNFNTYDPSSHQVLLIGGQDLRRPTLWDILTYYGKKSIVINEPMSYPPHKIQGIMVSGLMTPEGKIFTYPETLSPVLDDLGYKREAIWQGEGLLANYSTRSDDFFLTERKRLELALLLMEKNDWDLFFCMFSSTDRIMHHIGKYFTYKEFEKNLLEMDRILGLFLDRLPEGSILLLVSDHGFDFYPRVFSVRRWLEKEGYLTLSQEVSQKKRVLLTLMKSLMKVKEKTSLPDDVPGIKWPHSLRKEVLHPPLSWKGTVAFPVEAAGNWGSIRLLKKGNEKKALEKEIVEKLSALVDPRTGQKAVKQVIRGENLFKGPYQDRMPDLVFEVSKTKVGSAFRDNIFQREPLYHHRREGVLLAWGRNVRRGARLPSSEIVDIAPTALYLLDLPVAEDLDGKIVETLFESSLIASQPLKRVPHYFTQKVEWVGDFDQSGESAEDIKETLRSLGYLQ